MSTQRQAIDYFSQGRRDAFAEIRISIRQGEWNEAVRARWMKEAKSARSQVKHRYPDQKRVTTYHAGYLSALKSRQGERFAEDYQTGWNWYGDEDNLGVARPVRQWNNAKLKVEKTKSLEQTIAFACIFASLTFLLALLLLRVPLSFMPGLLYIGFRIALLFWTDAFSRKGGNK